jgi:type IV pilus assembly protein PilA
MFKLVNKRLRNRKGFTLIELVVVIAILGILAAIAIPRLGGFTDSAKVRAAETNHKLVVNAINVYFADNNAWPTTEAQIEAYLNSTIASMETDTGATMTLAMDATTGGTFETDSTALTGGTTLTYNTN